MKSVVIVGGGLAGATAAGALRSAGYDGVVVLLGDEPRLPYDRPPLSKGFLTGEVGAADLDLHSRQWYEERGIELQTGQPVWRVDAKREAVELEGGREVAADGVILATGARPRLWPGHRGGIPSSERVHYLRTVNDASALAARLEPGEQVVVLGAGLIGAEVAAAARSMGAAVTVVELARTPMEVAVGQLIGREVARLHRDRGVDLLTDTEVVSMDIGRSDVVLRTRAGKRIAGSRIVVALGAEPNVEVALRSGLAVNGGVCVGSYCETSAERLFAAGDVASMVDPASGRHRRFEHVNMAVSQASAAAKNVIGISTPCVGVYSFDSEQYGHRVDAAGSPGGADRSILHTSAEADAPIVLYLSGDVVVAVAGIDRSREVRRIATRLGEVVLGDPRSLVQADGRFREVETAVGP
jgi:3-phenylpropionate/trans-cinnamate dioxygenase ferredoxin reductase component